MDEKTKFEYNLRRTFLMHFNGTNFIYFSLSLVRFFHDFETQIIIY